MNNLLQKFWEHLGEIVFPHPPGIAQFNTLSASLLARTATYPWMSRTVRCLAPLPFTHKMVRTAIHASKYHNHLRAAMLLGETLAPFLAEELAERRLFGTYLQPLLAPVPLHPQRMRERGFNQSERIAHALIREMNDPQVVYAPQILIRTVNTAHQTRTQNRAKRIANMTHAFDVPDPLLVAGKDIIVLDDVITTGATFNAVHNALMSAGAREVLCVAIAH
ncbi:MAG: ComF family protein [Candidatus Pacebacteria bacterium]|nr:ComF family protein [Candidatus Paceibacterota bacterium]